MLQLVQQRTNTKWSPDEDAKLAQLVQEHGDKSWTLIASKMSNRGGKQCRERWKNQLDPTLSRDPFTDKEDEQILQLVKQMGTKWAEIARLMPGRAENGIKNRYYGNLQKSASKRKKDAARRARARSDDEIDSDNDTETSDEEDEDEADSATTSPPSHPATPPTARARRDVRPPSKKIRTPSPIALPRVSKPSRTPFKDQTAPAAVSHEQVALKGVLPPCQLPSFEATFQAQAAWMPSNAPERLFDSHRPSVMAQTIQPLMAQHHSMHQPTRQTAHHPVHHQPLHQPVHQAVHQPINLHQAVMQPAIRQPPASHFAGSISSMTSAASRPASSLFSTRPTFPQRQATPMPYNPAAPASSLFASRAPLYTPQSMAYRPSMFSPAPSTVHSSVLQAFSPSMSTNRPAVSSLQQHMISNFESPVAIKSLISIVP